MTAHRSRLRLAAAVALGSALALAACSGTGPADDETTPDAGTDAAESSDAFPVTIQAAYGDLTVEDAPERVVALGSQHLDILDALGVVPLASTGFVDEAEMLTNFPWLEGVEHGELDQALLGADYAASLEAIAAHEPDLILASTWTVSEELYEQISLIAPTYVGRVVGNNDWDVQVEDIGALTGASEAAAAALADVEAGYAAARELLPGLDGLTYSMLRFDGDGFGIGNGSWFDGFGMVPAEYQDNTQGSASISLENIADIDSDVIAIWFYQGSYDELSQDPRFQELPAVVNDAVIDVDLALANATNSAGPGSLLYAIDRVVPILEASAYAGE